MLPPSEAALAFRRRAAMRLMLGSAASLALPGCTDLLPPLRPPTAIEDAQVHAIDVHCHLFNADDIPVEGFVRHAVLHDTDKLDLADLLEPFIEFVAEIMRESAISARDEAREIRGGRADRMALRRSDRTSDRQMVREAVVNATRRVQNRGGAPGSNRAGQCIAPRALARSGRSHPRMNELLRVLADPRRRRNSGPQRMAVALESIAPSADLPPPPEAVADGAVEPNDPITGILTMATLMTRPRLELVRRLIGLADNGGAEIGFLVPAMVDFSYWVDDHCITPHAQQIDFWTAVAEKGGEQSAVHGWVSFCPWRQIVEGRQLRRVKDAVLSGAFVGVKMYPLMGFYPIGNADAPDAALFPPGLRAIPGFGRKLDDALIELYTWCIDNDVPIMAHCSHSQFPDEAAGLRGAPGYWETVLTDPRFRKLRLNIAHFGGPWHLAEAGQPRWTEKVIEILANPDFLNVHSDISDYDTVLWPDGEEYQTIRTQVARMLASHPAAKDRLMYGTDWVMLARTLGVNGYYRGMKRLATDLGLSKEQTYGFLGTNAARFLGLSLVDGEMPPTRRRLEAFYDAHKLDKALLRRFDKPTAPRVAAR